VSSVEFCVFIGAFTGTQVLWEEPKNPEVLWGLATHYIREGHVPMAMAQLR
jgi:cytochrome c-type biogenesis protein CcmH/NrfG